MDKGKTWIREQSELVMMIAAIMAANLLFFNQQGWKMNPVYIALTAVLFFLGIRQASGKRGVFREPRVWQGSLCMGLLFALMIVVGAKINPGSGAQDLSLEFGAFHVSDILWLCFYLILGTLLFFNIYLLSENAKIGNGLKTKGKYGGTEKSWVMYGMILALAWLPIWIIYYPGIMPEDATVSIAMVIGELPWDNHFPVFYSLIVGAFIFVGYCLHNLNLGIAFYSLVQLLTMAAGLGFFLSWLQKKGLKKVYIYLCLAYFAAAPIFGNYAIVMWKDPWFSGVLILLVMFLYDHVALDRQSFLETKRLCYYAGLILLMCLLRNNGIYIAILMNICLLIIYSRQMKRVFAPLIGSIVLVYLITGPVYMYTVSAQNEFVESVGIPLQQMARTVVMGGDMNEKEEHFLNELLPIDKYGQYYNPFLADPIKWAPEFNEKFLDTHKKEFFETWFSMLHKNLDKYVEQYLMGTFGYWHIGRDTNYELMKQEVADNTWGMHQTSPVETYFGYPMKQVLGGKYDYIATGLLIWMLLFDAVLCWMKRQSGYIVPLLIMIGNWMTLMVATPTAFGVRYIYVCVLGLPLLLIYPWLVPGRGKDKPENSIGKGGGRNHRVPREGTLAG